ncbi:MAG: amidase [Chloroflexi bacterium]|nr:amidase [Chloroflexota bacterium]
MDDLCSLPATRLAQLIRGRQASATEVVGAHLRRIEAVNPRINAVVQLRAEAALKQASAADAAIARGDAIGPLHGVPFTVKDWIETSDLICVAGFEERRSYVPKRDATAVARMRAAGAILLGKTNVNDGSPVYARPNNPHDLDRSPGASSSGEAAIIAAGGSPLGIASDSGGSIRWPAHCCGVAALKPTSGLVPNTGHFPRIGAMSDPRTAIGPMARSIGDLALALPIIAGPDGRDAGVVPMPIGDMAAVKAKGLRVAHYTRMPDATPSPETVAATEAAARALEAAGARVSEARPPRLEESLPITLSYWRRPSSVSWSRWMPSGEAKLSGEDVERHLFEWERFRRYMVLFMEDYDVIVCPVAADAAPPHGPVPVENWLYTLPYSLTGQPVAVVRAGTSAEGLPIGVQVVARSWRDDIALAAAAVVERALGPWPASAVAGD